VVLLVNKVIFEIKHGWAEKRRDGASLNYAFFISLTVFLCFSCRRNCKKKRTIPYLAFYTRTGWKKKNS